MVAVPLPGGRFALLFVLDADADRNVTFLVMAGFWSALPAAAEVAAARPARASAPDLLPGYDDVWKGWFRGAVPADFRVVGQRAPSAKELGYAKNLSGTMVFGSTAQLTDELHRAWRLEHDRAALEAGWAAADTARARQTDDRRKGLTLPRMLRERVFVGWSARLAPGIVREVRMVFRDATAELIALEKSGTKRARTTVLKRITTELNALDEKTGFIETEEREQIVARIEEIAALVGLSNDDEALTGHRDW
jgi:hypothetical protein